MLAAALLSGGAGLAWLALAMDVHWRQMRTGAPLTRRKAILLRSLGVSALVVSLVLCLAADHATMAALVWVMSLAGSALTIALTLAWRPRALRVLVVWV
jgi:hypothetical protein